MTSLFLATKKRKTDSKEEKRNFESPFKSPKPPKGLKTSLQSPSNAASCSKLEKQEVADQELSNLSQLFLQSVENDKCKLTHVNNSIDLVEDENFISVICNPVTCSQYIQLEATPDDTLDSLFNNEIAQNLSAELTQTSIEPTVKAVEPKENLDYMAALFNDSDVFKSFDAEELKGKKAEVETNNNSKQSTSLNVIKPVAVIKKNTPKRELFRPRLFPVSSNAYIELGPFFGLTKRHKEFILKTKNIESLYDWQEECLGLRAIHDKTNLIYALPTSGGKTLVAEIAMFREILLRKKNIIFVLPYVSIVQEKVQDLMPFAVEFNFLVEEYCAGKGAIPPMKRRKKNAIYICTIEKSQILFDSLYANGRLNEIGMIVVDELHMVGDASRGYSLETLLAKTVYQNEVRIQVIGMSATISNLRDIARFLKADIYTRDFRPVELKEYVKIGSEILSIDSKARFLGDAFKPERTIGEDYTSKMLKRDPEHVASLVLEVIPKSSCLVFCATKQYCENVAILLADLVPKELRDFRREEKINLLDCIKADSGGRICSVLAKTIPFGIAYHHSGLTNDERKHLEEAYRLNIICIICCTSTLAAGVNLPARRVIIRTPYIGSSFLTLTRYKQMVGRAGRAGKCETGESIMICDPKDHEKLTNLLCSKMDETVSGFMQDEKGQLMRTVVLNLIGTKLASSIDDLVEFFKCSLLCVQLERAEKRSLREVIIKGTKELMDEGALTHISISNGTRFLSFTINVAGEIQKVFPDDILQVSKLGKAAVNAGLSLEDAQKYELDLKKAQENLVLSQCLHLLFIVAPDDNIDSINPDNKDYNHIIMRMEPSKMNTAKVVGITENLAMKMITRPGLIKASEKLILKRFYVALMLFDLWNGIDVHVVASQYKVNRGIVYNLMNSASSKAYSIFKFCELYEEFWVFKEILEIFSKRLAYCCSIELLPLMELPAVKIVS